jgi:hypothetical protein
MDALRGRSGADCFARRIMIAVGWMKPDAPRREDRKEKPLLAWGRGRSHERELSSKFALEVNAIKQFGVTHITPNYGLSSGP